MDEILLTKLFYICFTLYTAYRSYHYRDKSKLVRAKWLFAFLAGVTSTFAAFYMSQSVGVLSKILVLICILLNMFDFSDN